MSLAAEVSQRTRPTAAWKIDSVRRDFPLLYQKLANDIPLAYLDNAATTQKPNCVIEAVQRYYRNDNANVHRGLHTLAERATAAYEGAREKVRNHLNARSSREIIFLRGTTEAINLVASSFGRNLKQGDNILLTTMEHHANIVPWQLLRDRNGIMLRVLPINPAGELDLERLPALLDKRTRLIAVTHVSNVLGTINPVAKIIEHAHSAGIPVLVDGAQAMPHMHVDVQKLDCDFYCFSGHKMFAPTGIGVLYGKESWLETMPPYQGGGEMIRTVSFEKTSFADLPHKFEAGTPHIAGAVGLGAAIDYLHTLDLETASLHEKNLLEYATRRLHELPDLCILGNARNKIGVVSFVMKGMHAHDLGTILDTQGVAVRAGHHCAMPLMNFFGVPATTRASFAFYNTKEEIDRLIAALNYAQEILL